jgi:hypothetical protein
MIALRQILARLQSQPTGCMAVLRVDLRDGTVLESCGDGAITTATAAARVLRELAAPEHVIHPRTAAPAADAPQEVIVLGEDATYVCERLSHPPHHAIAVICRNPFAGSQNLGLIVALLHDEMTAKLLELAR